MKVTTILVFALCFVCASTFESNDEKKVEKFLSSFYDYDEKSDKLSDGVKKLQEMAGLEKDGKVTKELLAHVCKSRCGGKDHETKSKRYNIGGSKWDSGKTYRFYIHKERNPPTMTRDSIRRAIHVGLSYWSSVADINFGESGETRGSLFSLSFADGEHVRYLVNDNFKQERDPYPLDNVAGGVLAHAFFPRDGNLHFDTAEKWTEGSDDGINLRIVTAHEGGHAIGLHHSNDPKALMAPWYGGYISERDFKLPSDDTEGAIKIYGNKKGKRAWKKPAKRSLSKNMEAVCAMKNIKSAFAFSPKNVFIVSDDNDVYRISNNTVDDEFTSFKLPSQLQDVDTIVHDRSGHRIIVFKGEKIFAASGVSLTSLEYHEMNITQAGAFDGKVSAAFTRDKTNKKGASQLWAIQNGEVLSVRIRGNKVRFGRRTRKLDEVLEMSNGGELPPSIDGAFMQGKGHDLHLVFFVGNSVYVGTPEGSKNRRFLVPASYPKTFKTILGCPVNN